MRNNVVSETEVREAMHNKITRDKQQNSQKKTKI